MKKPLSILLATDAWRPQVNGVVRTWETSIAHLQRRGHAVEVVHPGQFRTVPLPFYPEIRLAWLGRRALGSAIRQFDPDAIHIATEGPIGLAVRAWCVRNRRSFTTSYHSKFPEYVQEHLKIPAGWSYRFLRWFHGGATAILVSTPSLESELAGHGFRNMARWSRGVDLTLFAPRPKTWAQYPRPILLYAGRVSKEKNLDAFLNLRTPGTMIVVGDGPAREKLQREFPDAVFLGYRSGPALAEAYSNADAFVFPSKTDTFGLVLIEALACGVPVAAYPVVGPIDIVTEPGCGALNDDLSRAIELALATGNAEACVNHARKFTWERCTDQLLASLAIRQRLHSSTSAHPSF